jgi:hypothetical protein
MVPATVDDGVYDCRANRKAIFNRGMVPNINPNPRGRKQPKRGSEPPIFKERFRTIEERVYAWPNVHTCKENNKNIKVIAARIPFRHHKLTSL